MASDMLSITSHAQLELSSLLTILGLHKGSRKINKECSKGIVKDPLKDC